uniref:indoleamine 2,3-dioxygenase 2 isoform X6 n=1 Tax=Callithrix jacchus TaxID=9483 RepID=UPI0023DD5F94|nr:indoleamine 2,3-dioxygenase 2 isoform X6 [Callithrix jacchus]
MEPQRPNVKTVLPLSLERYHISEEYGFLLPDSLKELPDHYRPWMEIANKLTQLIDAHQLRVHVDKMPLLSCQFLKGHREQRLAHLVLSFLTMGYVWQEGEAQPAEVLPRNLALPLVEVSRNLGLPPILVHSDLVLTNWTKKDPDGFLEIGQECPVEKLVSWVLEGEDIISQANVPAGTMNLETIISFPGGESLHGFILVTVLVEKAAVPGIKALVQAMNAILQPSQEALLQALKQLRLSIQDITKTLGKMHDLEPNQERTVIHNCYKENKIPRKTTNKEPRGPLQGELQTTAQRNKRGHKQMEKHSMFMVRKNQYRENGHTAQSNLQTQCYSHQATIDFLHRTGKKPP